ncbi:MAG TPA: DUF1549 domain-containing protein, partial [Pirellula sp.]|nr:DUF1549 domain-containing protein [Pirellula sp.]
MNTRLLSCFACFFYGLCAVCLAQNSTQKSGFFEKKIQPIFRAKCFSCHGPKTQKSTYRLDVRAIAFEGGDYAAPPIVPGNVGASLLLEYVSDENSEMAMPPKDSQQTRLTLEEITSLRKWIEEGASWPDSADAIIEDPLDWWSFKPIRKTAIPTPDANPIDSFVTSKLLDNGLRMSPPADARTLARRIYFDLIGLPPSPEALDAFERDFSTDAELTLARLVDQLLAMPQYGERWARHWLDVVH